MNSNKKANMRRWVLGLGATLAIVVAMSLFTMRFGEHEAPQAGNLQTQGMLVQDCVMNQVLSYAPCGHTVERRTYAPSDVIGLNRTLFEERMSDYRVSEWSEKLVKMSKELQVPCPAHWVLKADEDGLICIYRNLLGEDLTCLRKTYLSLPDMPEADKQTLRMGMLFDDAMGAESYLESIDS